MVVLTLQNQKVNDFEYELYSTLKHQLDKLIIKYVNWKLRMCQM